MVTPEVGLGFRFRHITESGVLLSFTTSQWEGYMVFGFPLVSGGFRRSVSDGSSPKQSL
jgi:hypothetical protein